MKKKIFFYLINIVLILYSFYRAYEAESANNNGFMEGMQEFLFFSLLFILGIVILLTFTIINFILWNKNKKKSGSMHC